MRRLYRSRTDKVMSGLCGGIAAWLGVSSIFVRLATIIMALCSFGTVLLFYLLCVWIVPSEPPMNYHDPYYFHHRYR